MYDYRKLTADQRIEIVAQRVNRGFPCHRPPHPDFGSGWYFITAACYEHAHHLTQADELTSLQRRLFEALAEANCECGGWVVLSNHYHLLVKTTIADCAHQTSNPLTTLGRALGSVHGRSSRYANLRDATPKRQVWCRFTDRKLRSERHYWASLHYIIINPLKHGYVNDPLEWPWSCVHERVAEHKPGWLDYLRAEFPIKNYGAGWDD